jgi:signal peptide peptidase-like 2B
MVGRRFCSASLLLLLPLIRAQNSWDVMPYIEIEALGADGSLETSFYAEPASFGGSASEFPMSVASYSSIYDIYGCAPLPYLYPLEDGSGITKQAYILARGECSFIQKAWNAQQANADVVIIYDWIPWMYASANSTGALAPYSPPLAMAPCSLDCASGRASVSPDLVSNSSLVMSGFPTICNSASNPNFSKCRSNLCGLTSSFPDPNNQNREICCIANDYFSMTADNAVNASKITILALQVPLSATTVLLPLLQNAYSMENKSYVEMSISFRDFGDSADISGLSLWAIATVTVAIGAYISTFSERSFYLQKIGEGSKGNILDQIVTLSTSHASSQPMELSRRYVILALIFSSVFLLALYGLILLKVKIIYIMYVLFAPAAINGLTLLIMFPLVKYVFNLFDKKKSGSNSTQSQVPPSTALEQPSHDTIVLSNSFTGPVKKSSLISFLLAASIILAWFIFFRTSNYAWILQNIVGVTVCVVFLSIVRISSLKVAALTLSMFFFYDIFMVFITPFLFGGNSVMMSVANAGSPTYIFNQACYCRLHPNDDTYCALTEYMPILFRFPKSLSNPNLFGYSMLGFGDILIPGLMVTLSLRFDYWLKLRSYLAPAGSALSSQRWISTYSLSYFVISVIGYAFGLFLAFLAVMVMQTGQPALLYLCPCVLGCVLVLAWSRNELSLWWTLNLSDPITIESSSTLIDAEGAASPTLGRPDASMQGSNSARSSKKKTSDDEAAIGRVVIESDEDDEDEDDRLLEAQERMQRRNLIVKHTRAVQLRKETTK